MSVTSVRKCDFCPAEMPIGDPNDAINFAKFTEAIKVTDGKFTLIVTVQSAGLDDVDICDACAIKTVIELMEKYKKENTPREISQLEAAGH